MDSASYDALIATLASKASHGAALAEGYFVEGSLPQRSNNPGDLELPVGHPGVVGVDQGKSVYASADAGWLALGREWTAILTGSSLEYKPSMTFEQVAVIWTGGDNDGAWVKIVCGYLNVDPMTRLVDWIQSEAKNNAT
jgi:hypothetical protein